MTSGTTVRTLRFEVAGLEVVADVFAELHHEALRHHPDVTLEVIAGADHGLRVPDPGAAGPAPHPGGERPRAPGLAARMTSWARQRVEGSS